MRALRRVFEHFLYEIVTGGGVIEGTWWALKRSDFFPVLSNGDPREGRGYVAIPPTCGPLRRRG